MHFSSVLAYGDMLTSGLLLSIGVCFLAGVIGFAISVICAELGRAKRVWVRGLITIYVEVIRSTPFIVQLFFIFFGLAAIGVKFSPIVAAAIALSLNVGAYFTEIIRGGLEDTGRGVTEAAYSQGMNPFQVYTRIVLPPALSKVDRPLIGQFILVFLGSAVISQISVQDLTYAGQFIQTRTFRAFESYLIITFMYAASGLAFGALYALLRRFLFPWQCEVGK